MTANEVAYWNLQEQKRANLVDEAERQRANMTKEVETERSNRVREQETARANRAQEDLGQQRVDTETLTGTLSGVGSVLRGLGGLGFTPFSMN